ncbi:MAG: hypothetical protein M3Y51_06840 [Actinomycetota bacterium]|nr:hypothetical protein [Actinomycetota bacterium]
MTVHSHHARYARHTRHVAALAAIVALAAVGGACSSDDDASDETASTSSTSTSAASQFGSSMGVDEVDASAVSELGDGPPAGTTWTIPVGLSICGRFIEPLTGTHGGVTAGADGTVAVTGGDATPTVGDLAEAMGIVLEPGSITMPSNAVPAELDSTEPPTPVAGATLADGDSCGSSNGEVQVWVYSAAASESGDGIMVVTDDPAAVPFAEDGMSIVVAFAPESSLPTLPPSALTRG